MIKAFGYLRVSGRGQVGGNGFDRQKETIQNFANKSDIKMGKFFKEQVSGVKDHCDRDVFQSMVAEILRNGVRTIIVEGLSRLAREYRIQEHLLIYLGVILESGV